MKFKNFLRVLMLATASLLAACGSNQTYAPALPAGRTPEGSLERVLQPLPDSGFKAQIIVVDAPVRLARGQRADLTVRVKNASDASWPLRGREGDGIYQVNLGDRWIGPDGKDVKVDERVFLPRVVKPGETVEMSFAVIAPERAGDFVVEIDMVQEGIAWFAHKGSEPARLKIKVE
jgi:hypothetical protein